MPLPGLSTTISPVARRAFRDDLGARLATDENAPHRTGIADAQRRLSTQALGGRAIGEVGEVILPGMENRPVFEAKQCDELGHRRHDLDAPA